MARRAGTGWTLDGTKIAVIHGAAADELVVSARTAGGTSLFLVEAGAAGVRVMPAKGYDGVPVAAVAFDGVALDG